MNLIREFFAELFSDFWVGVSFVAMILIIVFIIALNLSTVFSELFGEFLYESNSFFSEYFGS